MTENKLRELLSEVGISVSHKSGNSRNGEWLVIECPFAATDHPKGTDRRPSFSFRVNPYGYSGFNCFTCKRHGNITDFLSSLGTARSEDYTDLIVRAWADEVPDTFSDYECDHKDDDPLVPIDRDTASTLCNIYPKVDQYSDACGYLKSRGITSDATELLQLRYDCDDSRILFPVKDQGGELYGFTGRGIYDHIKPKVKDYAGLKKSQLLLGEHMISDDDSNPILVVEGLFALAHMLSIGVKDFCYPVATMGSNMSEAQRDILVDLDRSVYMLYDNDEAGDVGMFGRDFKGGGALDLLHKHVPVFVCLYPDGINDPDNLSLDHVRDMILSKQSEAYTADYI